MVIVDNDSLAMGRIEVLSGKRSVTTGWDADNRVRLILSPVEMAGSARATTIGISRRSCRMAQRPDYCLRPKLRRLSRARIA